jgi:DNA-binding PadR family transcriptional regulator
MKTEQNAPLTEATFFILLSLSPAPKHGYAIMKEVKALSNGRIVFSTGTLYGALRRLLEQGWIRRVATRNPTPPTANARHTR